MYNENNDFRELVSIIKAKRDMAGYSTQTLALDARISVATLYRRFNCPETFTLDEIRRLERVLGCQFIRQVKVIDFS